MNTPMSSANPSMQDNKARGTALKIGIGRILRLFLLGVLAFSLPPLLLTLGSFVFFMNSDRILPGVMLEDLDLSWKTVTEVEEMIEAEWNRNERIMLVDLDDPARTWEDQASSFGLSVDAVETTQRAYQQGRQGQGLASIRTMLSTLRAGAKVDYVVSLDPIRAKSQLEAWAERVNLPTQDGDLRLEGREIIHTLPRDGKSLDVLASLDLLIKDPETIRIDHQMIPLVMVPNVSQQLDPHKAIETLETIVGRDAALRAYDPVTDEQFVWRPEDDEFQRWIDITIEGDQFMVNLIPQAIRAYTEAVNSSLGAQRFIDTDQALVALEAQLSEGAQQPEVLVVKYLPDTYIVQPGDNLVSISFKIGLPYWKLNEANPELARRGLVVGEELIVPPKDDMLALPVIPEKRIVISILEQKMWVHENHELLSEHIISTGIPNSPTLPGIFQVNSHYENAYASIWDLTMPHFMGIYDAVPGLTNGIHGLPLLSSGRRLWADVLGNPASYGCIILDLEAAEELFYWAEEGVVVEIRE